MIRKSFSSLFAVAAVLGTGVIGLTPTEAAAEERPFMAMLSGNAHLSPTDVPWIIRNDETGEGQATHLGLYTWASVEYVDFSNFPAQVAVQASFMMTAADGDLVYGEYTTVGALNEAGDLIIHGTFTFTGGTGRFAGATGGGDLFAIAYLAPDLPFIGMFDGTIDF
jgi:hypothetical protein